MTISEHRIRTWDDPEDSERSAWECDCGRGGSAPTWKVDLASDKHIREQGGHRVDVYGGNS